MKGPDRDSQTRRAQFERARRILFGTRIIPGTNREEWTSAGFLRREKIAYNAPFEYLGFEYVVTETDKRQERLNRGVLGIVWLKAAAPFTRPSPRDSKDLRTNRDWVAIGLLTKVSIIGIFPDFSKFLCFEFNRETLVPVQDVICYDSRTLSCIAKAAIGYSGLLAAQKDKEFSIVRDVSVQMVQFGVDIPIEPTRNRNRNRDRDRNKSKNKNRSVTALLKEVGLSPLTKIFPRGTRVTAEKGKEFFDKEHGLQATLFVEDEDSELKRRSRAEGDAIVEVTQTFNMKAVFPYFSWDRLREVVSRYSGGDTLFEHDSDPMTFDRSDGSSAFWRMGDVIIISEAISAIYHILSGPDKRRFFPDPSDSSEMKEERYYPPVYEMGLTEEKVLTINSKLDWKTHQNLRTEFPFFRPSKETLFFHELDLKTPLDMMRLLQTDPKLPEKVEAHKKQMELYEFLGQEISNNNDGINDGN